MDAFSTTGTTAATTALAADRGWHRLLRLLSALAYRAADRITLPQRDVPPEFYRFPPF